ncbi:hypothetical protein XENOCAPTIV_004301 [Xenoophorus captivus]|uniref:Myotubularin phosphatase domain-containing protein n=1 Tax=Xenoophorus captivus TaxID=1517983 RepID=A0ABV0QYP6_9TELE
MLDPHYRSLNGFQSLVQKEWVMAGHRFLDRCNHLKKNDSKEVCLFNLKCYSLGGCGLYIFRDLLPSSHWFSWSQSPLFTLFLDCVWQMTNQYPAAFEFTEFYLTVLSDSMWIPLFSTFLFNSSKQCAQLLQKAFSSTVRISSTSQRNGLKGEEEPLQRRGSLVSELKADFSPVKDESPSERFFRDWFSHPADQQGVLIPLVLPSHVVLWKLFFLRWVPEVCIPQGGPATVYHKVSQLVDEIEMLQGKLRQYKGASPRSTPVPSPSGPSSDQRRMYFKASSPDDPPTTPNILNSSFPFNPVGNLCPRGVQGTPISKFLNGAKTWLSTETLANDTF